MQEWRNLETHFISLLTQDLLNHLSEYHGRGVGTNRTSAKKSGQIKCHVKFWHFGTRRKAWKNTQDFQLRKWDRKTPRVLGTFQLRWVSALESALLAKGGALRAREGGCIDMMMVWEATVHWLTCHLLIPLALGASDSHAGTRLEIRNTHSEG